MQVPAGVCVRGCVVYTHLIFREQKLPLTAEDILCSIYLARTSIGANLRAPKAAAAIPCSNM